MFKKILSLFKKKEIESIIIKFSDIKEDFKIRKEGYIKNNILANFTSILQEMELTRQQIESLCKSLEDAKLKNPKITLRERHFMEGNRESYIKHVKILMRHEFPQDYLQIAQNHKQFYSELETFGSQTQRPRQILAHFFQHETEAIHLAVFSFKKIYDQLNTLTENSVYNAITRIDATLHKHLHLLAKQSELRNELSREKKTIAELKSELDNLHQELSKELGSQDYQDLIALKGELAKVDDSIKLISERIQDLFSPLQRTLKKYERLAMDLTKCLSLMISSSKEVLLQHDNKEIFSVLEHLRLLVDTGRLALSDDREKSKVLHAIDIILKENVLKDLQDSLRNKVSMQKELIDKQNSNLVESKINLLKEKVSIVEKKLSDHVSISDMKKSELKSLDEKSLLENIAQDYGIIIQKHVKII